jgi:hypothetical protein
MSRPTPETDAAEAKRRAEWLHKHKAHKDWIILSVSEIAVIRDELLILERERDEANEELHKQLVRYDQLFDEAEKNRIERDEAMEQAAMWKANHDNQVSLKAMLMDRPDLGDRASRIAELIRERDEAREALRKAIIFVDAYEPHSPITEAEHNETLSIIRKALEGVK